MAGAWAMHFRDKPVAASPAATLGGPKGRHAEGPVKDSAKTPAAPSTDEEFKAIKDEVASLTERVGQLGDRVKEMPKPEPAPDLKPIESRLDELAKTNAAVADLPKQVGALGEKVSALSRDLDAAKADLARLREQPSRPAEARTAAADSSPIVPDLATTKAVEAFKRTDYKEASTAFAKLAESHPDDARVWYYAALANGLDTKNWRGQTEELVKKGVAREKAGTPDKAAIDSAFAGLDKATGKDWLAYFRAQAK
jgi:hypothetical protein